MYWCCGSCMTARGGRCLHYSRRVFLQGMGLVCAHKRPISAVAHYHCMAVVYESALMESFAGLVQIFRFPALPDCVVEVGARMFWAFILLSNGDHS